MTAGRPTKLTPQIRDELCKVIAAGNYLETACAYVGVSKVTARNWLRAGARRKSGPEREFLNAIKKAMAQAEISDVATIKAAAKENWQAAAWRLERKNYKRWGRKDRVMSEITGKDGGPVLHEVATSAVDLSEKSEAELAAYGSGLAQLWTNS